MAMFVTGFEQDVRWFGIVFITFKHIFEDFDKTIVCVWGKFLGIRYQIYITDKKSFEKCYLLLGYFLVCDLLGSTGIQCMVYRNGRDGRDKGITDYHRPSCPSVYCKHTRHPNACTPLQWRHNGRDGVSNHQPHDCLLNRLFGHKSKKTSKLRVNGFCEGNSPGTGEFPAQMASNAENVSIWWRQHALVRMPQSVGLNQHLFIYNRVTVSVLWMHSLSYSICLVTHISLEQHGGDHTNINFKRILGDGTSCNI